MDSQTTSPATSHRMTSFADVLRERTSDLHRQAERSGIVGEILAGRITRAAYALFLRNLIPAYEALESGLERQRDAPGLSGLFRLEVFRTNAIATDLLFLTGADWKDLPILPPANRYAERIASIAMLAPELLIAHAYTRYLGDLGGGQILQRLVRSALKIEDDGLAFYAFPQVPNLRAFAGEYRSAIDFAATRCDDLERVVDEAIFAFRINVELSEAILTFLKDHESGL